MRRAGDGGSLLRRTGRIVMSANVTGMAGMVAYSALMSLVPIVLLLLFAISVALTSASAQATLIADLERTFPAAARGTLAGALDGIHGSRATIAAGALLSSLWAGISLWSAIDTAFRDIYGYAARSWLEQKRWAARMLVLALALVLGFIAVPAAQAIGFGHSSTLPLGLGAPGAIGGLVAFGLSHLLLFAALCVVYHTVPRGRAAWRVTWPGAVLGLGLMTIVSLVFPIYLARVGTLAHAGAAFSFVIVVLAWFYLMTLALLLGAALNAARADLSGCAATTAPPGG